MVDILRYRLFKKQKKPEETQKNVFLKHFIAGGIAGGISRTTTAPFDRMKVFYQVSRKKRTMKQAFSILVEEGGYFSLWRGNLVNVIKTVPKSALRFGVYDKVKKILLGNKQKKKELTRFNKLIAGSVAGLVTQTLTYPLDVLKVRMSLRKTGQYNGIIDALVKIYNKEGIWAFYKGFWANMVAIIPYSGLDLAGYEIVKKEYVQYKGRDLLNYEFFIVSGVSSCFSQITTYPLIVVITRMQAATTGNDGAVKIFLNIYKYEGFFGYFKGLTPNLIKFVPAMSITYFTYENIIYLFGTSMSGKG